jgi:signal transduction histidine kinase
MTEEQGSELGRTVIFTDITDERQRQQRIQVLNRVLRHNLRNELTVAVGYVDMLGDEEVERRDEYASKVQTQLDTISGLGDKARDIEKIMNVETRVDSPRVLKEVIEEAIESIDTDTGVSVGTDIPESVSVRVSPAILERVVVELLENAIEHTEASEIIVSFDEDGCTLTVTDNGSGIPETEIDVLEKGEETALEHGSGLGLWLVKWGVDQFNGILGFESDMDGTRVSITLPEELVSTGG